MRAARLDPFSARLHAIHLKGAKDRAQPLAPKPESARPASPLLDMSAPESATGVIERQRSHSSWDGDDGPPAYRTWERESARALERQREAPIVERTHEYEEAYAEQRAFEEQQRTSARDDDAREDIRMVRRRLGALESEVKSLKEQLDKLTAHARQPVQEADDPTEPDQRMVPMQATDDEGKQWFQSMSCDENGCPPPPAYADGSGNVPQHLRTDPYRNMVWGGGR